MNSLIERDPTSQPGSLTRHPTSLWAHPVQIGGAALEPAGRGSSAGHPGPRGAGWLIRLERWPAPTASLVHSMECSLVKIRHTLGMREP